MDSIELERGFEKLRKKYNIKFNSNRRYSRNNLGHLFKLIDDVPFPLPTVYDCSIGSMERLYRNAAGILITPPSQDDKHKLLLMWDCLKIEDIDVISTITFPRSVRFDTTSIGNFAERKMDKGTFNIGIPRTPPSSEGQPSVYDWVSLVLEEV